jgi:ammonium transporter, Amt family
VNPEEAIGTLTPERSEAIVGLRGSDHAEEAGLDIAEHGRYGYPEQFIPAPELVGFSAPLVGRSAGPAPTTKEVPAS